LGTFIGDSGRVLSPPGRARAAADPKTFAEVFVRTMGEEQPNL
jgi:hypothetical protein